MLACLKRGFYFRVDFFAILDGLDPLLSSFLCIFLHCPQCKQCVLTINLVPRQRIEPGAAGWEARTLTIVLCGPRETLGQRGDENICVWRESNPFSQRSGTPDSWSRTRRDLIEIRLGHSIGLKKTPKYWDYSTLTSPNGSKLRLHETVRNYTILGLVLVPLGFILVTLARLFLGLISDT